MRSHKPFAAYLGLQGILAAQSGDWRPREFLSKVTLGKVQGDYGTAVVTLSVLGALSVSAAETQLPSESA